MLCWHFWHQYRFFTHHLKAKLNPSVSLAPCHVYLFWSSLYCREKSNQLYLTSTVCYVLGALFHAKWLLPQVNLHPHFPPASLCSLPGHEDGAAGCERALTATFWLEVSLQHCHCWAGSYLFPSCSPVVPALLGPCLLEQARCYQASGEDASQGWCSAWSTACGNTAWWESSFSALLLLMPLQVNPCAESTDGLCSLWMWLCVLKAALPFLFHKGLLMSLIWGLGQLSAWPATFSLGSGCQTPSHSLESQLAGGRAGCQKKKLVFLW